MPSQKESPLALTIGIVLAAILVAVGVLAILLRLDRKPDLSPTTPVTTPSKPQPTTPLPDLGREAAEGTEPLPLPPLDESDDAIRRLVSELSSHPDVARWLVPEGLVRRFVVVVDNIAEGRTPRTHLKHLAPARGFEVEESGGTLRGSDATYARHDALVDAFTSVDPSGAARLYHHMKPLCQQAYVELGYPQSSFDDALARAMQQLLQVPVPDTAPELLPGPAFHYADPGLQGLASSQKVLLRLGPRNARRVQDHLRRIARALGMEPSLLP